MIHAIYPGSFDPIHNGHLDIIQRSSRLYDQLTVAVLNNPYKQNKWFKIERRLEMIKDVTKDLNNVQVDVFEGLLVDYAKDKNAQVILKSLRNAVDFDYEASMAYMNQHMFDGVETMFLLTKPEWSFLSSSRVKEIVSYGVNVSDLVPKLALEALKEKLGSH